MNKLRKQLPKTGEPLGMQMAEWILRTRPTSILLAKGKRTPCQLNIQVHGDKILVQQMKPLAQGQPKNHQMTTHGIIWTITIPPIIQAQCNLLKEKRMRRPILTSEV